MPDPAPFTMEDVVNGVLLEMRYAPGRDVQIHLQSSIVQDANVLYRTLMKRYLWRDYTLLFAFDTDPSTGMPTQDLSAYWRQYSDVRAVYIGTADRPLPFGAAISNPLATRQPTVYPVVSRLAPFQIFPHATYTGYVWIQTCVDTDFDLDDEVPFYKDMLIIGTAYQLSLKSGTNEQLTGQLKSQFEALVTMYRMDEVKDQYAARPVNVPNPMQDWWMPA